MLARVSRELARMEKRKLGIVDDCVDGWCDRKLRLADSDFPIGLPQTRSPALRTLGPTRSACWSRGSASHIQHYMITERLELRTDRERLIPDYVLV